MLKYVNQKEFLYEIPLYDGTIAILKDTEKYKALKSDKYNFLFIKSDGFFVRWGKSESNITPQGMSQFTSKIYSLWKNIWNEKFNVLQFAKDIETDGDLMLGVPEILDIEISEICDGVPNIGPCAFCYKNNIGTAGKNMSLHTFIEIMNQLPKTITQIAFGIGSINTNPDLWNILDYTRNQGIIPNITINGYATEDELDRLASKCGAVAVSLYDKEISFNTIKYLTDKGMKQVNIHKMISNETYDDALQLLYEKMSDVRLSKLNAIVFLSLKQKGRAKHKFSSLEQSKFDVLLTKAFENNISIGFDSCSSQKVFNFINNNNKYNNINNMIEPCESSVYSTYINVIGDYYPCSFSENEQEWTEGISVLKCKDFLNDIWYKNKTIEFKEKIISCRNNCVACPLYKI